MTSLLNRVCTLCGVETYLEDGFVQCDCMKVDEYAWSNGISETPKEWVEKPPEPNDPRDWCEHGETEDTEMGIFCVECGAWLGISEEE